ncbi:cysteine desulfurase [Streptomyces sp. TRM 70351]|uniref:aminotransferase class V-fold PLP-dependent enzyme n=1 Tax=Streptomyces sp. TRM 70351 TaxID=3116552 RepID=UPI002E7B291B|nr:cysteine desulfurase [Streptomyces sp. TRM 70351]MEE1930143.1 cysteine desulfurase [Streptomyces sp. TRM 70351]
MATEPSSGGFHRDVRADFPILAADLDGRPPVYLDNAATTQKPRQVLDAMHAYYCQDNSNVGRSVHTLSMRATDRYEQARERVARFVNASGGNEIVFTKGTTESVNLVAEGFGRELLRAGDEVLISGLEHHSNLLPWRRLCERTGAVLKVAAVDEHGELSAAAFSAQLSDRTRIVAVAHVSNVQGTVTPVGEVIEAAHARGAVVVVDGAQAVAHRAVDVQALDADFYCFSAHKMYGPLGTGVLYGKAGHLARMEALLMGGGMVRRASYDGPLTLAPPPHLMESGTPNIAGAVGLAAAMDYLDDLGVERVAAHDAELTARAAAGLRAQDGVTVFGAQRPEGGIVSFAVDGIHPYDVGNHLNNAGIATRTGVHCAMPFVDSLGVVGTVRASFGVYNTAEEADLLVETVKTAEKGFWSLEHPNDRSLAG